MTAVSAPGLGAHQFVRGMPAAHLDHLAQAASLVTVPAGRRFFSAGQMARRFWLIRTGQVALDLQPPGAERLIIVESLGRGEMVGLSWFTPPFRWEFGAVALQPTEAFEFDGAAVREWCERDRDFGFEFTRRLIAVVIKRLQATRAKMLYLRAQAV